MKQPRRKVLGDLYKVINGWTQRSQARFLLLHVLDPGQIRLPHLGSCLLLMIGQDMCRLIHQRIGALDGRPQRCGARECLGEDLLQVLQSWWQAFFSSTRAMESLICVRRSFKVRPAASNGARPSSVKELRTAR